MKNLQSFYEFLNESTTAYKPSDFDEGDIIHFKDGEAWRVVKAGLRGSNNQVRSNEITIKPENKLAKDRNVSMSIDVDMDYLNKEVKKIEKK